MPLYRYELRQNDIMVATGRLPQEDALSVGDRVVIAGHPGLVRDVVPQLVQGELRLIVELMPLPSLSAAEKAARETR